MNAPCLAPLSKSMRDVLQATNEVWTDLHINTIFCTLSVKQATAQGNGGRGEKWKSVNQTDLDDPNRAVSKRLYFELFPSVAPDPMYE